MRTAIIPAQITSVEDKIGKLSIQQATLLGLPLLSGFGLAAILPPSGSLSLYKIVIVGALFVICGILAVRVQERIIMQWLILFIRYSNRPQYYVYNKNSAYLRDTKTPDIPELAEESIALRSKRQPARGITIAQHEFARIDRYMKNPKTSLKFEVGKKGELYVKVAEVE